jgi:hypothetical protein
MNMNLVFSIGSGVAAGLVIGILSYNLFFDNLEDFSRTLDQAIRPDFYAYLAEDVDEHYGKNLKFRVWSSLMVVSGVIAFLVTYYFVL